MWCIFLTLFEIRIKKTSWHVPLSLSQPFPDKTATPRSFYTLHNILHTTLHSAFLSHVFSVLVSASESAFWRRTFYNLLIQLQFSQSNKNELQEKNNILWKLYFEQIHFRSTIWNDILQVAYATWLNCQKWFCDIAYFGFSNTLNNEVTFEVVSKIQKALNTIFSWIWSISSSGRLQRAQ